MIDEVVSSKRQRVQGAVAAAESTLIPLLDRIHDTVRHVYHLRDAKSGVHRPFRSDSFDDRYLQELYLVSRKEVCGFFSSGGKSITEADRPPERKSVRTLLEALSATLIYDRELAKLKSREDRKQSRGIERFLRSLEPSVKLDSIA